MSEMKDKLQALVLVLLRFSFKREGPPRRPSALRVSLGGA